MFAVGIIGVSLDAAMQAVFIRFVEPLIDRVFVAKDAEYGMWLAMGILGVVILRIIGHFSGAYGMEWTGREYKPFSKSGSADTEDIQDR